ncbi:hypothetical protein [Listeria phage WIL-1]|uniref:AAA+ ATPase domain-containing protein n=1 Tax=Listeria phage WIL-1 TaxID=1541821 RepID=A0A088FTL8_9CAUD|nr:porphyrin biosynthesis [Listeria phage WIL-1]AIM49851.1 hypothetical protein [Listeria phage WIL-1]
MSIYESIEGLEQSIIEGLRTTLETEGKNIALDVIRKELEDSPFLRFFELSQGSPAGDVYQVDTTKIASNPTQHYETARVASIVSANVPVWLWGQAGTGKTSIAQSIAKMLDLEFYPMQKIMDEFELKGFVDANSRFVPTPLYEAMKNGGLLFIDEIDASVPEALILINTALANNFMRFADETVYAHKDFRVIVAGNTLGKGGNNSYARNKIDSATLDRFVPIEIGYDEKIELLITNGDRELVFFVALVRIEMARTKLDHVISYRALSHYKKFESFGADFLIENVLFKTLSLEDITSVARSLSRIIKKTDKDSKWENNKVWKQLQTYLSNKGVVVDDTN